MPDPALDRTLVLPLRTKSPNGGHEHWTVVHRRRSQERAHGRRVPPVPVPCVVTLTRLSSGTLDDDNLRGALKGVRDGVADALGVKDNDPRVRWDYAQARCKRGQFGVHVRVSPVLTLDSRACAFDPEVTP